MTKTKKKVVDNKPILKLIVNLNPNKRVATMSCQRALNKDWSFEGVF